MVSLAPRIIAAAQAAQWKYDVPASVTLGQFGLESSWGLHEPLDSNNPFGIKALPGQKSVTAMTTEYVKGHPVKVKQAFRKFASLDEAFAAHAVLLSKAPIYQPAMQAWLSGDLAGGIRLMGAHYATAPNYADQLISLINSSGLAQYDHPVATPAPSAAVDVPDVPALPPDDTHPPVNYDWLGTLLTLFMSLFARKS